MCAAQLAQALPPIKVIPDANVPLPDAPPPPQILLFHVRAHVLASHDSSKAFVLRTNGRLRSTPFPPRAPVLWSEEHHEDSVVTELLLYLLQDIVDDSAFQSAVEAVQREPAPFFSQLTSTGGPTVVESRPVTVQGAVRTSRPVTGTQLIRPSTRSATPAHADISNETVLFNAEFQRLAEEVVDSTLANILSEAEAAEFNITARARVVALPPHAKS